MDKALKSGFDLLSYKWSSENSAYDSNGLGIIGVKDDLESWGTATYLQKAAEACSIVTFVRDISEFDFVYSEDN